MESVSQRGMIVYAPVKDVEKQQQQGKDPYAPERGDSPEVAAWRSRMGTDEGREKYKQRAKCEWSNAQCRNRGSTSLLRGRLATQLASVFRVGSDLIEKPRVHADDDPIDGLDVFKGELERGAHRSLAGT